MRGFKIRLQLWWKFNNPNQVRSLLRRNKRIKYRCKIANIPYNMNEIIDEFNKGKPGFLLKYPEYFRWVDKYERIMKEEGNYTSFTEIIKSLFDFK